MTSTDAEVCLSAEDVRNSSNSNGFPPTGPTETENDNKNSRINVVKKRRPIRDDTSSPTTKDDVSDEHVGHTKRKQNSYHNTADHHRNKKKQRKQNSLDMFAVFSFFKKNKQTLTYAAIAIGMAVSLYPFLKYQLGWTGGRSRTEKSTSTKPRRFGPENKHGAAAAGESHIPSDMLGGAHHHMHPPMGGGRGAFPEGKAHKGEGGRRGGGSSRGGFGFGSLFGGGMGSLYSAGAIMFAVYSFAKVFMRRGKNSKSDEDRSGKRRGRKRHTLDSNEEDHDNESDGVEENHIQDNDQESSEDEDLSTSSTSVKNSDIEVEDDDKLGGDRGRESTSLRKRKTTKHQESLSSATQLAAESEAEELRRLLAQAQERLTQLEQQGQANQHEKAT